MLLKQWYLNHVWLCLWLHSAMSNIRVHDTTTGFVIQQVVSEPDLEDSSDYFKEWSQFDKFCIIRSRFEVYRETHQILVSNSKFMMLFFELIQVLFESEVIHQIVNFSCSNWSALHFNCSIDSKLRITLHFSWIEMS